MSQRVRIWFDEPPTQGDNLAEIEPVEEQKEKSWSSAALMFAVICAALAYGAGKMYWDMGAMNHNALCLVFSIAFGIEAIGLSLLYILG